MPNHTILLVDYEPRSVERSRKPLVEAGFKVHLAPDGVAALEAFERVRPDLVLIEAMLPKKNGFEVCQELRRTPNGKSIPILITTAVYKGRKYRSQALHVHGADEYIEKPVADDQLVAMVRRFVKASNKGPASASDETPATVKESASEAPRKSVAAAPSPRPVATPVAAGPSPRPTSVPVAAPVAASSAKPPRVKPDTPAPQVAREAPVLVAASSDVSPRSASAGVAAAAAPASPSNAAWRAANALMGGLTEDEISERLDELLPSGLFDDAASARRGQAPSVETDAFDLEAAADVLSETDPDFDAALVAAPEAVSVPTPVFAPESTDLEADSPIDEPAATERADAGVVRFDSRRSKKKNKKGRVATSTVAPPAMPKVEAGSVEQRQPVIPATIALAEPAPSAAQAAQTASTFTAAPASRSAEPVARSRGIPMWVWVIVLVGIGVAAYFVFFQSAGSSTAAPVATPPVSVATNSTSQDVAPSGAPTEAPVDAPTSTASLDDPASDGVLPTAVPASSSTSPGLPEPTADTAANTKPPAAAETTSASQSSATSRGASAKPSRSVASPSAQNASSPTHGRDQVAKPNAGAAANVTNDVPSSSNVPPSNAVAAPSVPDPVSSAAAAPVRQPAVVPAAPTADSRSPRPDVAGVDSNPGVDAAKPRNNPPPATPAATAPTGPVQEGDLLPLAAADHPPIALNRPAPNYPRRARADGQEGDVDLSLLIDETGRVADLKIVSAANPDFGEAATKVARTWTYKPAVKNGVRVKVWKPERVIFRL